ncbi:MAG: beta strand repeat-containing protein [Bryobacteraceae bacterium]
MRSILVAVLVCLLCAAAAWGQIIVGGGGTPTGIPPGSAIWYGAGAPASSVGSDGDYYLDTVAYCLYGPKAAGVWPSLCVTSVRLVGYVAENAGNKGAAGGYAGLDANALVPTANLPPITAVNGTAIPGNNASDQTVVTTAPSAGVWTSLPSCPDVLGSHLNYNVATHGFLCGNTGSSVGSVGFSGVAGGTNANGLLVSGSLEYTGAGLIDANKLGGVSLAGLSTGLLKITTGTGAPSIAGALDVTAALGFTPENTSNSGAANGYAPLDSNRLLPLTNLPAIIEINGTSVPANNASDQTIVTAAPSLGAWAALPSCPDTGGNHLNYSVTTHGFQCGNTVGSAGSVSFGGVSAGTNSSALLIGGSLSYTSGGLINANQLGGVTLASLSTGLLKITGGSGAPAVAASSDVTATLGYTPENTSNKGAALGYAGLDSSAHLVASQMPVLSGDIANSGVAATVTGLQGRAVSSTAPASNQVLQWNGSQWAPASVSGAVTTVFGRAGVVTASAGDYNFSQIGGTIAASQLPGAASWSGTLGSFSIGPGATGSGNGSNNVGIGTGNLTANTTGYQNIAVGQSALSANTTGSQNVAVGSLAMVANTTGSYNTAVGENALGNNTTGYDNFAFGLRALYQNTTGYNNAAFGIDSVGINTTGYRNSGFGTDSCAWNVTGYENACMGMNTLWSLTTGYDNTGTGFNAMFGATSGHYLTGVGAYADLYYPNTMAGVTLTATSNTADLSVGWYWYKVSFVLNGQETALSNNSYLGVLTDSAHREVTIAGLPIYSGPFVASARRIYRTVVCPATLCTVITANQAPRQWYYVGAISDNTTTAYVDTTADANLGPQESSTPSKSVALGAYATVYGSYEMVVGSDPSPIQQIWLGNGMVSALSPAGVLVSSSGASGTNVAGQDMILAGGPGTGSANGGNVIFGTVPGGASGSLWNSLVNRWKIDSATGNLVGLSTGGITGVAGTVDFSGGTHTLPAKVGVGASKPSTCTVGEQYFANDAPAGQNLFGCTAANTWTVEAGSASSPVSSIFGRVGAVTAQAGDYTTTQVTEGTNLYFTTARAAGAAPIQSIFGRTGTVTAAANDYNLSQISSGVLSATGGAIYNAAGSGNTQIIFKNSSSQAVNGAGPVLWQNNAGATMSFINWDGGFAEGDGTNYKISLDSSTLGMSSDSLVAWRSMNNVFSGTADTGLARESAGVVKVTNGSAGYGVLDTGGLEINGAALALAGDVTGSISTNTVSKIQGLAVSGAAPSSGQVLQWNGSQWAPGTYSYSQISGTLPDAALPADAVTATTLNNSTLTAALTSVATTSDITAGGALTATGNVYANAGSNTAGCLHLSDTNAAHDMGLCAPSSGFNGLLNLWSAAGTAGQVTTTDGANNLLWSNLGGIAGTLAAAQMPSLAGDVSNSGLAVTVTALQGRAVAGTAPSTNQVLQWNGSQWAPGTVSGGGAVSSVFGRTGAVTAQSGDYTLSQVGSGTLNTTGGTIYNSAAGQITQIVVQNGPNQASVGAASVLWKNNAGSNIAFINWDGGYSEGDGTNYKISLDTSTLSLSSDSLLVWHSVNSTFAGTIDTALAREAAGVVKVTNGATAYAAIDAGGYSASGTPGVTSATCTQWTNGLCTHN